MQSKYYNKYQITYKERNETMLTPKQHWIKHKIPHIRLVQDYGAFLEFNSDKLPFKVKDFEILNRTMKHDLDKFEENKIREGYLELSKFYENRKHNIPNLVSKEELKEVSKLHYETQDHHIEYHIKNGTEPDNAIICEMCCDSLAISTERGDGVDDAIEYFLNNRHDDFSIQNKEKFLAVFELLRQYNQNNLA